MELLPTDLYNGPPPRYAVSATVYYHGQPYTVTAVCGRAPLVGWTYEIDGPGEVLRVGEGEISSSQMADMIKHTPVPSAVTAFLNLQTFSQQVQRRQQVYGAWLDPVTAAVAQQLADEEAAVHQIAALSGQPPAVCRAALADYCYGAATLIDQLKWGMVEITPDGDVVPTNYNPAHSVRSYLWAPRRSAAEITAALQAAPPDPPAPRLNRATRRSKHRHWTLPAR